MASRPDPPDLEGFIDDCFFFERLPDGAREKLIAFYEPHRRRTWRNDFWELLPQHHEDLFMADDDFRALERAAVDDPQARTRLTMAMIRRRSGVALVWAARVDHVDPKPPPGTVCATLHGYATGGETPIGGGDLALTVDPTPKRAWLLASMNLREAIFGREAPAERLAAEKAGLLGPWLLELETGRLVTARGSLAPNVTVETDGSLVDSFVDP